MGVGKESETIVDGGEEFRKKALKDAPKDLKPEIVPGKISQMKAIPHRGSMIYIRRFEEYLFEYLVVFKGEIYSDYLISEAPGGKRKLTDGEIKNAVALILTGAMTTLDMLFEKEEAGLKVPAITN